MKQDHIIDALGRRIHVPCNPRRIDGLVAEDKVRTLTLFRPGNFAEHPTAPTDIAPFHDELQGIGTHVKSIKQARGARNRLGLTPGTLELASTLESMRLKGHQRFILLAYELDGTVSFGGKSYPVRRYHTAIEAIASPTTLAAFRGRYTLQHLAWIQRRLDACRPTPDNVEHLQDRFRDLMAKFEDFFGIARPSVKLSVNSKTQKIDNQRVQSSLSLERFQEQLMTEGPYEGRFLQENYREFHEGENFYGLELPWFTISKDRIFGRIGDPDKEFDKKARRAMDVRMAKRAAKQVVPSPPIPATSPADRRYATETPHDTKIFAIDGGTLTIVHQLDDVRTMSVQSPDPIVFARANAVIREAGAVWLPLSGRWAGDIGIAMRVYDVLEARKPADLPPRDLEHVDELPPAPEKSLLQPIRKRDDLLFFDTGINTRQAGALRMERGNWALLHHNVKEIRDRIDQVCSVYAPTTPWDGDHDGDWTIRYNDEKGNWLVNDTPADLIERVARAIQEFKA